MFREGLPCGLCGETHMAEATDVCGRSLAVSEAFLFDSAMDDGWVDAVTLEQYRGYAA